MLADEGLAAAGSSEQKSWRSALSLSWRGTDLVYVISRRVLLSYALLVGLTALTLLAWEIVSDRRAISSQHQELYLATEKTISEAMWTFNETLLGSIVTGLSRDSVITGVSIHSPDHSVMYNAGFLTGSRAGWGASLSDRYVSEWPIIWRSDRGEELIGVLVMETSEQVIRKQLLQRVLLILLFSTAALFSLFGVFFVVIRQHVVRPISILTDIMEQFRLGEVRPVTDTLTRPSGEIGRLFDSFELMESRLRTAHEQITSAASEMTRQLAKQASELSKAHQRSIALEIARAQDEERKRLVRDMHDGFGSELASARIAVERGTVSQDEIATFLSRCIDDLHLVINVTGSEAGRLADALADWRYRVSRQLSGEAFRLTWDVDLADAPEITQRAALQILRIGQEALFNAARHSGASEIVIRAGHVDGMVFLEVRDNGKGFLRDEGSRPRNGGKGVASMIARARELEAHLEILSKGGCMVKLTYRPPVTIGGGLLTEEVSDA